MTSQTALRGLITAFLLVGISSSLQGEQFRPNVLLILSDDHSVPHVSCYGDENTKRFNITPNLQKFGEQGMRFDRAYTSSPQCAPSRISMFACRSPVRLGVTRFAQPPRGVVRFFTDVLRANGYWVGLDGRHQHLDGRVREAEHINRTLREAGMQSLDERFDHFVRSAGTKGDRLFQVADRVSAALDKVPDEKPFFLYFGFNQPHRKFALKYDGIDPDELKLPADWLDGLDLSRSITSERYRYIYNALPLSR